MVKEQNLQDARQELAQIFQYEQDDLCEDDSSASKQALRLLLAYPELASEEFEADEEVAFKLLPLSIFITSGAGIQVIEAVEQLYPQAVSTKHPELKFFPLQAACEVHADGDVIEFLANKYPMAVEARDNKGDLIIHSVLSQGKDAIPRRKTVERLLDLYPESLRQPNHEGVCPLGIAFRARQSSKIIDRIIEKRLEEGIHSFEMIGWKDFELNAKEVSRFGVELFPKLDLKALWCEPDSYGDDGFAYLMEYLMGDRTIEKLSLSFPPLDGRGKGAALLNFFRNNITVRHLSLSRNVAMWSQANGMDYLLQGMGYNPAILSLQLSGLFLMSSFELGYLISRSPKKLILNNVMVSSKWATANVKQWGTSMVTDLTLRNCKMRGKCLDKFLDGLKNLPALKRLTLDFTMPEDKHDEKYLKGRDITKPILSLLKNGNLEGLILQGLTMDIRKLSVKLNKDTTLKKLRIDSLRSELSMTVGCLVGALINDNRTLEDIKFHCDYDYEKTQPALDGSDVAVPRFEIVEDPAIKYYTTRNRTGKKGGKAAPKIQSVNTFAEKPRSKRGSVGRELMR
ncbi:expressed unknown protein [Seminavis robusta]|uniref:Uncharacterized protein n=1 Tax=Seminavis robusta TaxID=568900 RepID=A0A9N8DP23_9STRA|nr:expressed unknown protein [Seminavis robusta]|eukprot:Sro269_g103980.1 n/a (569) ;mRNA; r:34922-36811